MTAASIRRMLPVAAVAALAFALPSGALAKGGALHCGQTVRTDVTLTADLDCSSGGTNGLYIGKDGVTVDLNHHKIIGAGGDDGYEGIENDGYNDVTIENGTIEGFKDQILLNDVVANKVSHTYLNPSSIGYYNGVLLNNGSGTKLTDNHINDAHLSIQAKSGSANLILRNRFTNASYGLWTQGETGDKVVDNVSDGLFSTRGFYSWNDQGILFRGDQADGGYYGFYASQPAGVKYVDVTASHNVTSGIYVDLYVPATRWRASIWNSTANDNGDYGMYAAYPVRSGGNVALRNAQHNCNLVRCNG
jgi:hypothetical protein